jgi:hypothetical protein
MKPSRHRLLVPLSLFVALAGSPSIAVAQIGAAVPSVTSAVAALPKHFPLPARASVRKVHREGANVAYRLHVSSAKQAVRFWRRTLPKRGWVLGDAVTTPAAVVQPFSGHGYGDHLHTSFYIRSGRPHKAFVAFHRVRDR